MTEESGSQDNGEKKATIGCLPILLFILLCSVGWFTCNVIFDGGPGSTIQLSAETYEETYREKWPFRADTAEVSCRRPSGNAVSLPYVSVDGEEFGISGLAAGHLDLPTIPREAMDTSVGVGSFIGRFRNWCEPDHIPQPPRSD